MANIGNGRGILYPTRLPTFHREPAPTDMNDLIRWFWIPQWDLAPGRTSRQELLPFPASNLVVQPVDIILAGPTTGRSHRDLEGDGWAVGALLRPAGIAQLHSSPAEIRNAEVDMEFPDLHRSICRAMAHPDAETARQNAVVAYVQWAREKFDTPDGTAQLANQMEDLIASEPTVTRVDHIAEHLAMSVRSVQRLAQRYIGLSPLAVIRRYRLQEAAHRLREDDSLTIAQVAADLGYADHAHLNADFRTVLGMAPQQYRRQAPQ